MSGFVWFAGFTAGVLVALAVTAAAQQFYPGQAPSPWSGVMEQQRRAQQQKNELLFEQYLRDQLAHPPHGEEPC